MSSFVLKLIAVFTMVLDHTQAVFPETFPVGFRVVGRVAFPLFVFLIAEGFRHTRHPGKFLARLFVFALISEVFFDLALMGASGLGEVNFLRRTNIFYTLFLGGAAITIYKHTVQRFPAYPMLAALPALPFFFLGNILGVDYGWAGVFFIFAMYVPKKTLHRYIVMAGGCLLIWGIVIEAVLMGHARYVEMIHVMMITATLCSVPIAAFYNGKRGADFKWFFYIFYPAHLGLLVGLRMLFG